MGAGLSSPDSHPAIITFVQSYNQGEEAGGGGVWKGEGAYVKEEGGNRAWELAGT